MLRDWSARYRTHVYYLSSANLELVVSRPPLEPAEAARVAVEQYAYCDDLSQSQGEPVDLADGQVRSTHWCFWWD